MSSKYIWVVLVDTGGNDLSFVSAHATEAGAKERAAFLNQQADPEGFKLGNKEGFGARKTTLFKV